MDAREDSYIQELAARIEALGQLHQAVVDFSQQFSLDPLIDRIEALEAAQQPADQVRGATEMVAPAAEDSSATAAPAPSAPEQGPTDEELIRTYQSAYEPAWKRGEYPYGCHVDGLRAVLARWGRPAVEPVPESERPWERDGWCDKEGMCWMGDAGGYGFVPSWRLCKPSDSCLAWSLPHWAIPVPQEGADA